jgi:hypothetical protein
MNASNATSFVGLENTVRNQLSVVQCVSQNNLSLSFSVLPMLNSSTLAGLSTFAVLTTSVSTRAVQSKDKSKLVPAVCKVWNPVDGTMTPLVSRTSDIFDVWMVYDSDNIWGNVQNVGLPCDMNWDLSDRRYPS